MSEEQKVALVTGASRGIGRAIASRLSQDGYVVVGTATSDGGAEAISAYLSELGNTGCGMRLDVSDAESVSEVMKAITERFGAPLVLVNNAGITRDNLLMRMKADEWDDVIATNLSGVYRLSKACLRGMMKAKGGRIINIASVIGASGSRLDNPIQRALRDVSTATNHVVFDRESRYADHGRLLLGQPLKNLMV